MSLFSDIGDLFGGLGRATGLISDPFAKHNSMQANPFSPSPSMMQKAMWPGSPQEDTTEEDSYSKLLGMLHKDSQPVEQPQLNVQDASFGQNPLSMLKALAQQQSGTRKQFARPTSLIQYLLSLGG